jgi:hypothetical protein
MSFDKIEKQSARKGFKQIVTADSTTEVEYIVASDAARELVWIRRLWGGLGVVPTAVDHIPILYDNNGAIFQAKEPKSSN